MNFRRQNEHNGTYYTFFIFCFLCVFLKNYECYFRSPIFRLILFYFWRFLDEMCADDEVDAHAIWYLTLASEVLRGTPGTVIFENRKSIDQLLALILRCKCKDAFHVSVFCCAF